MFGSSALLRLRLRLAITDFCWVRSHTAPLLPWFINSSHPIAMQKSAQSLESRNEFGAVAQDLLSAISYRVLGILIQQIDLVAHLLTRKLPYSAYPLSEVYRWNHFRG